MKEKNNSSNQKIFLKCKPFASINTMSPASTKKVISTKNSKSKINSNIQTQENSQSKRKVGIRKRNHSSVQCSTDEDDDDFVVRKKKSPNKRQTRSNVEQRDDEDNGNSVETKKKTPRKRRSDANVQCPNNEESVAVKKKTPTKRRKPLLTIKCNKITDYFRTAAAAKMQEEQILDNSDCVPDTSSAPKEVVVLSSSDEHDDLVEQNVPIQTSSMVAPIQTSSVVAPIQTSSVVAPIQTSSVVAPIQISSVVSLNVRKNQPKQCPDYKIIDGTSFAVDAFSFGKIAGVTKYFLTHFHSDHYVGLTEHFKMPIYMSTVTGRLVKSIIKVNQKYIRTMNINTMYVIDGVEVTPIDANHCPGAVMFSFKLPCGRTILHTGDFRATPEMESNPVFWNNNFHSIYLDTTYLHKSFEFCTQNDALYHVEYEVKKFKEKNIGMKFLIVVGTYLIGKERVWSHIAQTFKMKVWLEANRREAFDLIYSEENGNHPIKEYICDVPEEAQLHILPLQNINYPYLDKYLKKFEDHNVLAFRPTGWAKNVKPQYGSRISIVSVQYSEHSSYRELERFVRFVRPEEVISTVPISSSNRNTPAVPKNWLTASKPMQSTQRTVTSFMRVRKNSLPIVTGTSVTSKLQVNDNASYDSLETDYMP